MTKISQRGLFWAPRVLSIAYIGFLSLFALDVFSETHGFWTTLLALLIHLVPALILVAILIVAWRWEWVGASLFAVAGLLYILTLLPLRISPAIKFSWILTIAAPAFLVAVMFLVNWLKRDELHPKLPG